MQSLRDKLKHAGILEYSQKNGEANVRYQLFDLGKIYLGGGKGDNAESEQLGKKYQGKGEGSYQGSGKGEGEGSGEEKINQTKPNQTELVPAQAPPLPPVKKSVPVKKKIKDEKPEPHWQAIVEAWFAFNKKEFGDEPSFAEEDPKHLKRIIQRLKKRAEVQNIEWTETNAVYRFNAYLKKCFADDWLPKNFLLSNLLKQFDKIILNQNGKQPIKTNGQRPGNVQPRVVDTSENWGR